MRPSPWFLTACMIALASAFPAAAATITWNSPGTATYLNNNGNATATLGQLITGTEAYGAYLNDNYFAGCSGNCGTVQTIDDTVNARTLTFDPIQFNQLSNGGGFGTALPNTGIAALNYMTTAGWQGASGHGGNDWTITGLTPGQAYDIQVFFWFQPTNNTGEQINGTSFVDAGGTDPSFATGSFTADASTELVAITGGTNNNFSAFLLTDAPPVPEPASLALLAAGLLGLGVTRRRRGPPAGML